MYLINVIQLKVFESAFDIFCITTSSYLVSITDHNIADWMNISQSPNHTPRRVSSFSSCLYPPSFFLPSSFPLVYIFLTCSLHFSSILTPSSFHPYPILLPSSFYPYPILAPFSFHPYPILPQSSLHLYPILAPFCHPRSTTNRRAAVVAAPS